MKAAATPPESSGPRRKGTTSRRTLLRTGLALPPVILAGVWGGHAALSAARTSARPAGAASSQTPACTVTPQVTEGPYFVDAMLFRSDIREDPSNGTVKDGLPLRLGFRIMDVTGGACTALTGAVVDVWQCDALGVYSDTEDPGFNTVGQKFLRGSQYTDENGAAEFLTIYPGWYQGRTVHIHFKVRTDPDSDTGYEFTSQLFFDDALSDEVFTQGAYAEKGPNRDVRNANDSIYQESEGETLLELVEDGDGYATTIEIGVDMSVQPSPGGPGGPPGGQPPGATPVPTATATPRPVATPPAQRPSR
jgi:protocatechuate 3,4-dioxygenase beta subunit